MFNTSSATSAISAAATPTCTSMFKPGIRKENPSNINSSRWMRNLYWNDDAFKSTTEFTHIKCHYTKSHKQINPFSITPVGPVPDILPLDQDVPAAAAAIRTTNH